MSRCLAILAVLFAALFAEVEAAPAATLQQLSVEEMTQSATAIVRARVSASTASFTGKTIYTHYRLQVSETWKGRTAAEVMVPGGVAGGARQSFPGVPELASGTEYVLFLWTSPAGITHLIGLTQGIFAIAAGADGVAMASRPPSGEMMLDARGQKVTDQAVRMRLADMKTRVSARLPGGEAR